MLQPLLQLLILLSGVVIIVLISSQRRRLRLLCYGLGLISEPLWFWTAWVHGQWGIYLMSLWYMLACAWGIWNTWKSPRAGRKLRAGLRPRPSVPAARVAWREA